MQFFYILIISLFAAVIASTFVGVLFKDKMPDIQNYTGPMILAAVLAAAALGLFYSNHGKSLVEEANKAAKEEMREVEHKAYDEGYESGYDYGREEGYGEGYREGKADAYQPAYDEGYTAGYEFGVDDALYGDWNEEHRDRKK